MQPTGSRPRWKVWSPNKNGDQEAWDLRRIWGAGPFLVFALPLMPQTKMTPRHKQDLISRRVTGCGGSSDHMRYKRADDQRHDYNLNGGQMAAALWRFLRSVLNTFLLIPHMPQVIGIDSRLLRRSDTDSY